MHDRRQHERRRLWIPIEIEADDASKHAGVVHDVSDQGVLAVTDGQFEVDARVDVTFYMPPNGVLGRHVAGRVARSGVNTSDADAIWHYSIAVQFDEAIPEIEALAR